MKIIDRIFAKCNSLYLQKIIKNEVVHMIVYNNICEKCRNMDICSIWKNIKKFSEDYARHPYPTDIEIKDCRNFVEIDDSEDSEE